MARKIKPQGEPGAGVQVAQRPYGSWTTDDELIQNALKNQSDHMSGRVMAGSVVKREARMIPGKSLDQQIASARSGGDNYYADLLENYKKGNEKITQKEKEASSQQTAPTKKKKPALLTGNQGIAGSMLNLGSNKLLGGN